MRNTKNSIDDKKTFDMYHFFSRWDMLLAAGVIIVLMLIGLYLLMAQQQVA